MRTNDIKQNLVELHHHIGDVGNNILKKLKKKYQIKFIFYIKIILIYLITNNYEQRF